MQAIRPTRRLRAPRMVQCHLLQVFCYFVGFFSVRGADFRNLESKFRPGVACFYLVATLFFGLLLFGSCYLYFSATFFFFCYFYVFFVPKLFFGCSRRLSQSCFSFFFPAGLLSVFFFFFRRVVRMLLVGVLCCWERVVQVPCFLLLVGAPCCRRVVRLILSDLGDSLTG